VGEKPQWFSWGNMKERNHLLYRGVDGRTVLGTSFIVAPSIVALSYGKPAFAGAFHGTYGAQDSDKADTLC
jgi:hypothetical protein